MKLNLALASTLLTGAYAKSISQVKADSKFGMDLLSKARRVEDADAEADITWVTGYALKFQGCHHIAQWNPNADEDENGVKVEEMRLAKFRLCPVETCSDNSAYGCTSPYGEYIVPMDDFLLSYLENKEEVEQEECEDYAADNCACEDNGDDQYDEEACLQACYENGNMSDQCVEQEENDDGNGNNNQVDIDVNDYAECAQYQGRRRLEDGGNGGDAEYYIGPFCSDNGGSINLGLFTEDTCTTFADNYGGKTTFYETFGFSLPYSEQSIVDSTCYTCEQKQEDNNNGYYQEAEAKEMCVNSYQSAGKCETKLNNNNVNANENGCTFIEGVKSTTKSGIIIAGKANKNKVASAFIGMFSISFIALGSYVYYLKTKLDRGSINLSD